MVTRYERIAGHVFTVTRELWRAPGGDTRLRTISRIDGRKVAAHRWKDFYRRALAIEQARAKPHA